MEIVSFIPPNRRRLALLAAQADDMPVLILGASGTGKGAISRWIHQNSPRSTRPFIELDKKQCLSQQFLSAQGGAILIPEIGDWNLREQGILLTYIHSRSIPHPDAPSMKMLVNVRVMATTSRNLDARAQGGLFNAELLKKLSACRLEMPTLSERLDEFEDIALGILAEITRELHREHIAGFHQEVWTRFKEYPWPGNIRELRNVLRAAVISCSQDEITLSDLPDFGIEKAGFRSKREAFEKLYLTELLRTFHWKIDKTCQASRMSRESLLNKIKSYEIEIPETKTPPTTPL